MAPKLENILSIDADDGGGYSKSSTSRDARGIKDEGTPNDAVSFHHMSEGRDCAWSVQNDLGIGDSVV